MVLSIFKISLTPTEVFALTVASKHAPDLCCALWNIYLISILFHTSKSKTVDCSLFVCSGERLKGWMRLSNGHSTQPRWHLQGQPSAWAEQAAAWAEEQLSAEHRTAGGTCLSTLLMSESWWARLSAACLSIGSSNHFKTEGKGYPHTVTAGEESPRRQAKMFFLRAMELCNAWNTEKPWTSFTHLQDNCTAHCGTNTALLSSKTSPISKGLLCPLFCSTSSAASLVRASKPLLAVVFLCKELRNPCTVWGFSCFCSSNN